MKKVFYYCDICNKEIPEKEQNDNYCTEVVIAKKHTWEVGAAVAAKQKDIYVCPKCGTKILDYVNNLIEAKGELI